MGPDTETVAETVADVTEAVVETAIENAEARADAAELVAEQITEAALASEQARQVEGMINACRDQLQGQVDALQARLDEQSLQLSSLRETQLSPETLAILLAMSQPAPEPSTPPPPPTPPEPAPETQEPAAAGDAPAEESREAAPRVRRHRFL